MLVLVDRHCTRPLVVTSVVSMDDTTTRVSGTLQVEPNDYQCEAFRGGHFEGRIHSRRIDGLVFLAFGELLAEGTEIGQWRRRG